MKSLDYWTIKACFVSNVRMMYNRGSQASRVEDHIYNFQHLSRLQHDKFLQFRLCHDFDPGKKLI